MSSDSGRNRRVLVAILVVGIVVGIGLGLPLGSYVLPRSAPGASTDPGPVPEMVNPSFVFVNAHPTRQWSIESCADGWGLPGEVWVCVVELQPNDAQATWEITGVNSTPAGTGVFVHPYPPVNCPGSVWTGLNLEVLLPPTGSSPAGSSLNLSISFSTA